MKTITPLFLFLIFILSNFSYAADEVRVYQLNCGHIEFNELSYFSDTGEYDGKKGEMRDPCFLIIHPKGSLLWDTGLSQALIGKPAVNVLGAIESVSLTIESQLKEIGLSLNDITYVGFSHMHFDHSGNADLFKNSTWIMQKKEFDFATHNPAPIGVDPSKFTKIQEVKKNLIEGDYDVFGDGLVTILSTPGHTPGHQSLMVHLKKSGNIIFSGDLFHFSASRKNKRIPIFNFSRAETLASIDRIDKLAKAKNAKVVIQHEPKVEVVFPLLPAFLN